MFVLITGKPRSGKSYYAVDFMVKNKSNYHNIYANVNGLKMQDNIKSLNFKKLMFIVEECKKLYDSGLDELGGETDINIIDKPIVDYLLSIGFISLNPKYPLYIDAKEKRKSLPFISRVYLSLFKPLKVVPKILSVLIIMDEAQNQLPSMINGKRAVPDDLVSWWISYHGHLYMDVFLLSQNYHKINAGYIYDIEYFLNAIPASQSILGVNSSHFTYKHHLATPYNGTNLSNKIRVKKTKEVFDSYESGDSVRTKSAILPYVFYALFGVALVYIIFYFVTHFLWKNSITDAELESKKINSSVEVATNTKRKIKIVDSDNILFELKYLKFNCIQNTCTNKLKKIDFQVDDLENLLKNTDSKYLRSVKRSSFFSELYLLVSPTFLGLFTNQGANDEQIKGFTLIN